MFFWWCHISFFMFLEVLCCCPCIYLKESPPVGFTVWLQRKILSDSLVRDSEVFFNLFYVYLCSTFFVSSWVGGYLKIICFLLILQSQTICCQPPVYFLFNSAECSSLSAFSQFCSQAGFLHMLTNCLQSLTLITISGMHVEKASCRVWVRCAEHWECPWANLGDP